MEMGLFHDGNLALRAPVIFLVFNRPEHTARVFERIREARPSRLFLVADGPRTDRPGDASLCTEVRRIVEDGVDWPCELVLDYSETNLGCARRVSSGISNTFEQVEEAIILEDDCLPDPSFFPFCDELLKRYQDDERVAQIAGCSFLPTGFKGGRESYFFSRYPHCWGWATWRRAWRTYDHSMSAWIQDNGAVWLENQINDPIERRLWKACFDGAAAGKIDSWAYRWTAAVWSRDRLTVIPHPNLVSNIGFGDQATHTEQGSPFSDLKTSPMAFPLVHPAELRRDEAADEWTSRNVFLPPSWPARIVRRAKRLFST